MNRFFLALLFALVKAVILAGGLGKRLRPYTDDRPKPLIEIAGRPIIEWQIRWLKRYGITSFIILAGYKKEKLIEFIGSGEKLKAQVAFLVEDEPLGTGGALKRASHVLQNDEQFFVINGDIISNINLNTLRILDEIIAISLVPLRSPYGVITLDGDKVTRFEEKPILKDHWINAGIYLMSNQIFPYLPDRGDLEKSTFPKLAEMGKVKGVKFPESYWRSIDSIKDMEEVSDDIMRGQVYDWRADDD